MSRPKFSRAAEPDPQELARKEIELPAGTTGMRVRTLSDQTLRHG